MKRLYSAHALERELGIRHGTVAGLVKAKRITPIYLPTHKRPKYDIDEVKTQLRGRL